jgi:hypothetical protein
MTNRKLAWVIVVLLVLAAALRVGSSGTGGWEYPLSVICVVVVLFLAFRAAVLWYWKISRLVALLEQLVQQGSETNRLLGGFGQQGVRVHDALAAPNASLETVPALIEMP